MEYRTMGRTGIKVSVLGYGAMLLRGPATNAGPVLAEDRVAEILNEDMLRDLTDRVAVARRST